MYNNRQKRQLLEKIARLTKTAHEEIFKMAKIAGICFTQNKNGVFFNMTLMTPELITQIENFVDFCILNNTELDEYDKRINECKMSNNYDVFKTQEAPVTSSLINILHNKECQRDDWVKAFDASKDRARLEHLLTSLEANMERTCKKKVHSKFANAKKRFSRRIASDKRFDGEGVSLLLVEPYIIRKS